MADYAGFGAPATRSRRGLRYYLPVMTRQPATRRAASPWRAPSVFPSGMNMGADLYAPSTLGQGAAGAGALGAGMGMGAPIAGQGGQAWQPPAWFGPMQAGYPGVAAVAGWAEQQGWDPEALAGGGFAGGGGQVGGGGGQAPPPTPAPAQAPQYSTAPPGVDEGWWVQFQVEHEGQDPEEYYGAQGEGLAEALGDLEWSQQFEADNGRPPTEDEWRWWWFHKRGMMTPEEAATTTAEEPRPPLWIPPQVAWMVE